LLSSGGSIDPGPWGGRRDRYDDGYDPIRSSAPARSSATRMPQVEPSRAARRSASRAIVVVTAVLFLFAAPPLTTSGLWDPYELNVADLSRRIALHLHGAANLAVEGADNSLPHLNALGRPQLPFSSIALGFTLFGLHDWAGRLPMALWGLLGVLATYAFA